MTAATPMPAPVGAIQFAPSDAAAEASGRAGFRHGAKGTHTSRTIMLDELEALLGATDSGSGRQDYAAAIIDANCLAKTTMATRRLSNQRLGELYALDPNVAVFRILRRLWDLDSRGRSLLAMLCALARDPLLRLSAAPVLSQPPGAELWRDPLLEALRSAAGDRLNDAILAKVMRNVASSWTQSGHLEGRTFKKRRRVVATPAAAAFALYLGHVAGYRGADLLASGWMAVVDSPLSAARDLALEAKRECLIDLRMAGDVVELNLARLDPWTARG